MNRLAYEKNDRGRYIVNHFTGKDKVIISGGSKVINQRVDYQFPLIGWADARALGVIGMKQGEFIFCCMT